MLLGVFQSDRQDRKAFGGKGWRMEEHRGECGRTGQMASTQARSWSFSPTFARSHYVLPVPSPASASPSPLPSPSESASPSTSPAGASACSVAAVWIITFQCSQKYMPLRSLPTPVLHVRQAVSALYLDTLIFRFCILDGREVGKGCC